MLSERNQTKEPAAVQPIEEEGHGILFVVSSPSGGGKGTLIQRMLKRATDLAYSVSFTTRTPRNGEVDGREYFFVSPEKFEQLVAANEFLECAYVHGKRYGTSRNQVLSELSKGRDIVLEVDVQGAASIRAQLPDSVSVFILPPSFEVLRKRLLDRGTESPEAIDLRLRNAPTELKHYQAFQYLIINDDADRAADQLLAIVHAERARLHRQGPRVKHLVEAFTAEEMQNSN